MMIWNSGNLSYINLKNFGLNSLVMEMTHLKFDINYV